MEPFGRSRCTASVRGFLLALAFLFAAATCTGAPPSRGTRVDCGAPSVLTSSSRVPDLAGAPIGPLLIRGYFGEGATRAVVYGFERGRATKMLVLVATDMDTDIALTGTRCSDAQPLRLWLNKGGGSIWYVGPASTPVPDELMATTGDLRAVLPKMNALASGSTGYGGYFLFPSAGSYRIEGFAADQKIGEAIIVVNSEQPPAPSSSPARP